MHTDADTAFEVNGTNYMGSAGTRGARRGGEGTATAAFGTLTTRRASSTQRSSTQAPAFPARVSTRCSAR